MKRRMWIVGGVALVLAVDAAAITFVLVSSRERARAAETPGETAEDSVKKTVDEAFAVLRDKSYAGAQRRHARIAALRKIADRTFDWSEMARSSLGASWRTTDAAKRTRFVDVFKDVLAAQYMDDIDRFQGTEKVTVDGSTREGEETVVNTTLITASRERVPIDYRMRPENGQWRIIDISIENVSLVNHFRKTFSNALTNMTLDQLIDHLQKQLPPAAKG
jgi:phospholipid transport system substrate-binding protein